MNTDRRHDRVIRDLHIHNLEFIETDTMMLCFQRQQWTPVVRLLAQKKHAAVRLAVVAEPASRALARRRLPHAALRLPRVTATALRRRQRRARVLGTRRLRVRRQRLVALVSESQVTVTRVHWSFISITLTFFF